jgi:large subunit ribosomal protein L16
MLSPKQVKWRKRQKGRLTGKATRGTKVSFGEFGIVALEPVRLTARQIEAARIAMNRHIGRAGQVWIRIFPDKPICSKPAEVRMGKGKGPPEKWVANIKPGRILFEAGGIEKDVAEEAFRLAGHKLPIKTKFVERKGIL